MENAAKKLSEKNLDLVIANDVSQAGAGFNVETNIARLLYRGGRSEDLPLMGKGELADIILDRVVEMIKAQKAEKQEAKKAKAAAKAPPQ